MVVEREIRGYYRLGASGLNSRKAPNIDNIITDAVVEDIANKNERYVDLHAETCNVTAFEGFDLAGAGYSTAKVIRLVVKVQVSATLVDNTPESKVIESVERIEDDAPEVELFPGKAVAQRESPEKMEPNVSEIRDKGEGG